MFKIIYLNNFKYLGLIFDRKLLWTEDIDKIEEISKKVINIIRYMGGCD